MPESGLSSEELLSLRNRHISDSCRLHFMQSPIKIVRSRGQYMFNEHNEKYLDCTSRTSAVGHCHPDIVSAACSQMSKLSVLTNGMQDHYSRQLLATLPPKFEVCLFTNSGGEANDLALQLARRFTGRMGVAVVDGAFHGAVVSLMDISPKAFRVSPEGKKPWVHVIPCPDTYREDHLNDEETAERYTQEAIRLLEKAKQQGNEIGCFICEPLMVVPGVIVPPKGWLKTIYRTVQDSGGLVISDEIVTGVGRIGANFWAFQALADGAVPDIVTVGKPLGNGHPIAAVLTTSRIASVLSTAERNIGFRCGPVEAAVGLQVLRVLEDERLMANAREVGEYLKERLLGLKQRHRNIGDVRGAGLIVGVEIVRGNKVPASDLAERFSYRLKDRRVLVAPEGEFENVLAFLPPYCLTRDDVDYLVRVFEEILTEVAMDQDIYSYLGEVDESALPRVAWMQSRDPTSHCSSESTTSLDYEALD